MIFLPLQDSQLRHLTTTKATAWNFCVYNFWNKVKTLSLKLFFCLIILLHRKDKNIIETVGERKTLRFQLGYDLVRFCATCNTRYTWRVHSMHTSRKYLRMINYYWKYKKMINVMRAIGIDQLMNRDFSICLLMNIVSVKNK